MRLYARKSAIILTLIVISLFLVLFYWRFNNASSTELLIAWGWQGDINDRNCILQVINPKRQELGQIHVGGSCSYQVVHIQGQPRLVEEQKEPRAMVVYSITSDGDLVIEKSLPVEGVTTPGSLNTQFGEDGTVYFAGILDSASGVMQDRMQILRMDPQTGEITPLAANEAGIAISPLVSPSDAHLIYLIHDGIKSSAECISVCGYYYHLLDLETNSDLNLASLVNHLGASPGFSHWRAQWSPDGRFLAFNLGSESESPHYIIIFNVEDNEIVTVIKPIENTSDVILVDWLSNDELVYRQRVHVEGYEDGFYNYFVYSTSRDRSTEFLNLALLTSSDGIVYRSLHIDWTSDGQDIVMLGIIAPGLTPLIIVNTNPEKQNVNYTSTDTYNGYPLWSPSGDWIAYSSAPDYDAFIENGYAVKITDRAGQILLDTDVLNIQRRLGYAWLRP